ncbi:armadillo-type protein [Sphaerosporella brunnea]|uniref:Armadillo-type protein n=1 Tax=Sphaerosporella brunnea TaxID=1250544 RepID=A0A5J5F9P5_9PEZI|nr:armadillo-type protein [Sphaerosporella brunnea]
MNGGGPEENGASTAQSQPLLQLKQALQIVYSPQSSNEDRKQAGAFLEAAKSDKEAPFHGFKLSHDESLEPVVRHFGLLLLENAIKYSWPDYTATESITVRNWILSLAENVDTSDPVYLRNKIAQLWVEVAKRMWDNEWLDMDELLVRLWENAATEPNAAQRDLVLFVLETLVDDVFNREDSVAGLRNTPLTKACFDIFTPHSVFDTYYPQREPSNVSRCGEDGWLVRLVRLLDGALEAGVEKDSEAEVCAIKILGVLKACMGWSIAKAVSASKVVETVGKALMVESTAVQMIATECLHILFSKPFFEDDDFQSLVCPMYHSQTVELLKNIFTWIRLDPDDIDEDRYMFLKKFSEMIANLGGFIEDRATTLPNGIDLAGFLSLAFLISSHESLAISIPTMNLWTRILRSDILSHLDAVQRFTPQLLELVAARLIRYECLEEDSTNPSLVFLDEDLDTIPERHAFLGNYRRFCCSIVESITRRQPFEAFSFIMANVDNTLGALYSNEPPFSFERYKKNSMAFLQVDAQFSMIEAALRGYIKWVDMNAQEPVPDSNREPLERDLEMWCDQLLTKTYDDPMIKRRIIQLMVTFSTMALDNRPDLMLKILEHILLTRPTEFPANHAYTDALKELMNICTNEIQRLAMKMPDHLMVVYDQLERKINEIAAGDRVDDRTKIAFHTFLFTINHRTKNIDSETRRQRLEHYVVPVKQSWVDPGLTEALASFEGFCRLLGLDRVQDYLVSRRVHEMEDFSQFTLDAEGQALQSELAEKFKALPIRTTKAFIAVSTERLKRPSNAYNISCTLWHDAIPMILPNLLKFMRNAHGFHNPQNWRGLAPEYQPMVKRILTDRFWQAGISHGSRDDFYENVTKTKFTMEGLASSIRGAIRMVRESCYSILWCMSRLDVHFYGLDELPGPLAVALFENSHALSSHQMSILLNMTRYIVDDCPVPFRKHFLTPLLASLFSQVDNKVSGEWNELIERGVSQGTEAQLAEEMKEESILRQLTYTAVLIVAGLLDPQRPGETNPTTTNMLPHLALPEMQASAPEEPTMREFILSSDVVLEPLILFCTHALRMRDSRCCGIIIRVFRSIVTEFQADRADIREFICREVLMAAIDSLHEDYFVDVQKDLAQLIATICLLYSPASSTPRTLLLSLPGITEAKVDHCFKRLAAAQSPRLQRALFLELLDGLRGVPMSEKGKLPRASRHRTVVEKERRNQQSQQMRYAEERRKSPDLGGVADMFA